MDPLTPHCSSKQEESIPSDILKAFARVLNGKAKQSRMEHLCGLALWKGRIRMSSGAVTHDCREGEDLFATALASATCNAMAESGTAASKRHKSTTASSNCYKILQLCRKLSDLDHEGRILHGRLEGLPWRLLRFRVPILPKQRAQQTRLLVQDVHLAHQL
jgi:hypothetical protein